MNFQNFVLNARLSSISGHFSTRSSEVRCEFANYVSKFGSWAGTSQLISEFNFTFRVLISHTKIINTRVTFEMAGEELTDFLRNI